MVFNVWLKTSLLFEYSYIHQKQKFKVIDYNKTKQKQQRWSVTSWSKHKQKNTKSLQLINDFKI